jgi:hypothetical protein
MTYIEDAVSKGDLVRLKYLHENGHELYYSLFEKAAWNGHINCLKYLHENGCPWNDWICDYAARN